MNHNLRSLNRGGNGHYKSSQTKGDQSSIRFLGRSSSWGACGSSSGGSGDGSGDWCVATRGSLGSACTYVVVAVNKSRIIVEIPVTFARGSRNSLSGAISAIECTESQVSGVARSRTLGKIEARRELFPSNTIPNFKSSARLADFNCKTVS
jgi:hypothetical protein